MGHIVKYRRRVRVKRLRRRVSLAAIFCFGVVLLQSCSRPAFVSTAALSPLMVALGDLKTTLDAAANTLSDTTLEKGDQPLADANRIHKLSEEADRVHQLSVEADQRSKQLDQIIKSGADKVNLTEQKIVADIADLTSRVSEEVDRNGFIAFLGVNITLVKIARSFDGMPTGGSQPYVFAVSPYRIQPDASDRLVSFYGVFPDADSDHPLTVTVGDHTYSLTANAGGASFEIPNELLREATFVELILHVPVKRLGFFSFTRDFHTRLYVGKLNPFSFGITSYKENPELWATIEAPREFFARADSSRTSVYQTLSAKELFAMLVNDNQSYDGDTASFAGMVPHGSVSDPPCPCGCDSARYQLSGWDAGTVTINLLAPTCPAHPCTVFQFCGGGGTHAEMRLRPTFRVKRRNVEEKVAASPTNVVLGRNARSADVGLDPQWSVVQIVGTFSDGEEWQRAVGTVSKDVKGVRAASADLWTAEVDNNVLHIETH
jgi:hypothetical protein